jgi:hypothetical protein
MAELLGQMELQDRAIMAQFVTLHLELCLMKIVKMTAGLV